MTRQQARIVVSALVVVALLVMIAVAGIGRGPNAPLEGKAERDTALRDGRSVSAPTATLLAGGLALLGVVLGLFGDRYLRHRGDILCRSSAWSMTGTLGNYPGTLAGGETAQLQRDLPANEEMMARALYGNYSCTIKLFNETEVATGLRDIRVVFTGNSGASEKEYTPQLVDSTTSLWTPT